MIRLAIALLCICFLVPRLPAQTVRARLDFGKRDPKPEFVEYASADNGLVTLGPSNKSSTRYLSIRKYDQNFQLEWEEKVIEQNGRKNVDFVTVIGQNILVFLSETFPKEDVIKSYYYAFNLAGEKLADQSILSVYPNEKEQKVSLQFTHSPNKRKLLCYKNLRQRRESEKLLYYIFDDEGDFLTNGAIELPYPDNRFRVKSLRLSNQGNVFVLGKFFLAGQVKNPDDFQYLVMQYNTAAEAGNEVKIDLGDRYITDLAFRVDRAENMYLAGFYSNRSTDRIGGTILQKISPSGEVLLQSTEAFGQSFLSNYLSSGQINRGRELRNFYMDAEDGIILRSDGGVLLIAEKFYVTYQSYQDIYGYWVDREMYHYEDVILTSVSPQGEIEWHAIVDKNQVSDSPANLSYFNAIGGDGAYIFYEYRPPRRGVNIYYNIVAIDGQVSKRIPLISNYQFGNAFYPRYCEQINNREAIMVYQQNRGRALSVVKVGIGE
ncbi:MAG: hypothetical protein AAF206_12140 [Bacteroidota bacterium]